MCQDWGQLFLFGGSIDSIRGHLNIFFNFSNLIEDCEMCVWCVCRCFRVRISHQSLGHGRFVLSGKVLFQSQDDTVGDDGGEDHVLEWSERLKLRNSANF